MTNIVGGFEMMSSMRELRKNMEELLEVSKIANEKLNRNGDVTLTTSVEKLAETVGVIQDTERMLQSFYKGEITLDELEAFRDEIAQLRK